jgi:hypothetical protein
MFMFDDVQHERVAYTAHASMATQQSKKRKTAYTLKKFLREPQHYVVLE